jgi:type I restriction enzyme M protein
LQDDFMARAPKQTKQEPLEVVLWKTADKLRKNIDAAEYKHVVLGLIFLKYISDSFDVHFQNLEQGEGEFAGADPEDRDEYTAYNVFFVPENARWSFLLNQAKQPNIGKLVDEAMEAIENDNPQLKGVLPKVYARQNLDPTSLGELIDLIGNIALGDAKSRSADVLGHVFEYFLGEFALAEGKQGGQFYTPKSIVSLLVNMLEPYKGRVFDPCCGSGGMFVQSEQFVESHQGLVDDISIYVEYANLASGGTRMPRADWGSLSQYPIAIPPIEPVHQFNELVFPSIEKIHANLEQIQTLENLRDTLLPKLMSGEVRVQYQTEEVA